MRFALVSREVYPLVGGGLSRYVTATAETLAELGEVTVFTTDAYRDRFEELRRAGSAIADALDKVTLEWVPEPVEIGSYYHFLHLWSAAIHDSLKHVYGKNGPDLIEFPDYHGEAFVTLQARRALDPVFRDTCIGVRLYTTSEMASVLNGHVGSDFASTVVFDMERYSLRNADQIFEPGGDIYATYQRVYGADSLAPATTIRHPVIESQEAPAKQDTNGVLRFLYVGRFERRKGVQNLIRSFTGLARDDWALTLVGGDTSTAPLGVSMRAQLKLMAEGDKRIRFEDATTTDRVRQLMNDADVVVVPSLWECWPNVALEALGGSTPVLATPTGGLVELVQQGQSGWLARDTSTASLSAALEQLLESKDEVRELARSQSPRRVHEVLTDRDEVRSAYVALVDAHSQRQRRTKSRSTSPLVSVVIPYYQLDEYLEATLDSIALQTYPSIETIVVNDGSFREADRRLDELAERFAMRVVSQPNSGLGAARNFGIAQSRGRYVFPLDADDLVAPSFVERCVDLLERQPEYVYATSWSRFIDDAGAEISGEGYQPLGICRALETFNVAGSAEAVFPKRVFELGFWYSSDLTSYEDWFHYRRLAAAGYSGFVIPERLLSYRVRSRSMLRAVGIERHDRLVGEIDAHMREAGTEWTSKSG